MFCDSWLWPLTFWPFDPKTNGFPRLVVEHLCVKFGDPSCIGFWDSVWKNRQTHKATEVDSTCTTAVGMGNKWKWLTTLKELNAVDRSKNIISTALNACLLTYGRIWFIKSTNTVLFLLALLIGQYCFDDWRLLSVVVCRRRLSGSVTLPAGGRAGRPLGA